MEDDYNLEAQDSNLSEIGNRSVDDDIGDHQKEFGDGYDEGYDDEDGNNFRNNRGRGNFRNRGGRPPPAWMNGPPMRFRGRGYGPQGPPMRGRGFFRGRGAPRGYGPNNGPNFDNNWGPMGPPPPGMMGGPPPFGMPPGMMPPGGPIGPPPNMMSQPPPFGGPPGMPPPNMQPAPELWVETKSGEGKPYYYHVKTRETTWSRPAEGPACRVVSQQEVEAMAAQGQVPGGGPGMSQPGGMPGGMPGMPTGMPGGMPPGMPGPGMMPPGMMPGQAPFMTPPPWAQSKPDGKPEEGAADDDAPPGEAPQGPPQGGAACFGGWAGWAGWPPPNMQPDNGGQLAAGGAGEPARDASPPRLAQPGPDDVLIPPALAAAAGAWSTHRAPDGRPYYYHADTQQSVWDKPLPLREWEDVQAKIAAGKNDKMDKKMKMDADEGKIEAMIDLDAEDTAERERDRLEKERQERERLERERIEKGKEKDKEKEKPKQSSLQVVSITTVTGSPWCVVWSDDGRVFYYDAMTRTSAWKRPAALLERADVDHIIANPPAAVRELQTDNAAVNPTPAPVAAAAAAPAPAAVAPKANGEAKRAAVDSDSEDSDPEPAKKPKQEEKAAGTIDVGAAAAVEAEVRAARERAVVPHDTRLNSFLAMLRDKQVSAFSTWEKELHKIAFDSRYLLLNSKERRQVFDQYVRDRAESEWKEKKNRLQQKKMAFRALMEEAKLHSKSSFSDFSSKHGRDERFKGIEKSRNRETYFNEYLAEVRKKEKEDKERKREQRPAAAEWRRRDWAERRAG